VTVTPPPAAAPSVANCDVVQRVEWDASSITDTFVGGIAVFGERRINNKVVHTFSADSLEIKPGINDQGRP
jgi:hypothetical protein